VAVHSATRAAVDLGAYYGRLAKDPRVLAVFDFQPGADPSVLRNLAKRAGGAGDGRLEHPRFEAGRLAGRVAVRSGAADEAAIVDLPGPRPTLTLAAWVNVSSLDGGGLPENRTVDGFYTASILMTDSQPREGQYVHWQFNWAGQMSLSVNVAGPQPNYSTPVLLNKEDLGRWHHVAMTYDLPGDRVAFYLDGRRVYAEAVQVKRPLTIGRARVGSWLAWDDRTTGRRLDGRVDELVVFDAALGERDVAELYEAGRPQ
jgi:hypothetical protein